MPQEIFTIQAPNGEQIDIEGDHPPSEAEILEVFRSAGIDPTGAKTPEKDWIDTGLDWAPTIGAMAGGAVGGGMLSIPLAMLGAAGGKGIQIAGRTLKSGVLQPESQDTAKALSEEAFQQGVMEAMGGAAGNVVGRVARPAGEFLMDQAIRPGKQLLKEFPDIVSTAMDENVAVGRLLPFLQKGSEKAGSLRAASAADTRGLLDAAGNAGYQIDPTKLTGRVDRLMDRLRYKPIAKPTLTRLEDLRTAYLKEHTRPTFTQMMAPESIGNQMAGRAERPVWKATGRTPKLMSPSDVKSMKQVAQAEAAPLFKAERNGAVIPTADRLAARFDQSIARSAKGTLESLPRYGRRIADSESRTQSRIGLERAIQDAESARMSFNPFEARNAIALGLGGGVGAWSGDPKTTLETIVGSRLLMNPTVLSHLVLGAKSAPAKFAVRKLPRAFYSLEQEPSR